MWTGSGRKDAASHVHRETTIRNGGRERRTFATRMRGDAHVVARTHAQRHAHTVLTLRASAGQGRFFDWLPNPVKRMAERQLCGCLDHSFLRGVTRPFNRSSTENAEDSGEDFTSNLFSDHPPCAGKVFFVFFPPDLRTRNVYNVSLRPFGSPKIFHADTESKVFLFHSCDLNILLWV